MSKPVYKQKNTTPPVCWICKGIADTGEHIIKRTDLISELGYGPYYRKTPHGKILFAQGPKSEKFKYPAKICGHCNNNKTQPHDRAWEKLAVYIRSKKNNLVTDDILNGIDIFGDNYEEEMKNILLFFLKHHGCRSEEHRIGIRAPSWITGLELASEAIMTHNPPDNVYIRFLPPAEKILGPSSFKIHATDIGKSQIGFISRFRYCLSIVMVEVLFAQNSICPESSFFNGAWHPRFGTDHFTVCSPIEDSEVAPSLRGRSL